jgi:NAD-dependent dihydropyrimidine dehydrogenase PreA subunit
MVASVKRVNAVWFSPTGTTKKTVEAVAGSICKNMGADTEYKSTSFTLAGEREKKLAFNEEDLVVFGVPVYAGRVPNILLKYLNTVTGGRSKAVPIVVYGNRHYDDALIELKDILEDRNFRVVAAGAFIGEHSFSKILAKDRPDVLDMEIAESFGAKICSEIEIGNSKDAIVVNGENPYRPYYRPRDIEGNFYDFRKIKPKTNDNCTDCKICVEVCPMESIDGDDVSKFTGICIKCGACIKKCPAGAKYYDDVNYLKHQHELEDECQDRKEPELFF